MSHSSHRSELLRSKLNILQLHKCDLSWYFCCFDIDVCIMQNNFPPFNILTSLTHHSVYNITFTVETKMLSIESSLWYHFALDLGHKPLGAIKSCSLADAAHFISTIALQTSEKLSLFSLHSVSFRFKLNSIHYASSLVVGRKNISLGALK